MGSRFQVAVGKAGCFITSETEGSFALGAHVSLGLWTG